MTAWEEGMRGQGNNVRGYNKSINEEEGEGKKKRED